MEYYIWEMGRQSLYMSVDDVSEFYYWYAKTDKKFSGMGKRYNLGVF